MTTTSNSTRSCDQPGGNVLAEVTAGLALPNHQQVIKENPMVEPPSATSAPRALCAVCTEPIEPGARVVECGEGPEHESCHVEEITELIQAAARAAACGSGRPSFEQMRTGAVRRLGDALVELRSDWRRGAGPTRAQLTEVRTARLHIARAKAALDRAATTSGCGRTVSRGVR